VIDHVSEYKYLGIWISTDQRCPWDYHVNKMVVKANQCVGEYTNLFRNMAISIPFKLAIYKAMVRPLLEYGSEIWTATREQLKAIERVQLRCAKMILAVPTTTASIAVRTELGLHSCAARYDAKKLHFIAKLDALVSSDEAAENTRHIAAVWEEARRDSWPSKGADWTAQQRALFNRYPERQELLDVAVANTSPPDVIKSNLRQMVYAREQAYDVLEIKDKSKLDRLLLVRPEDTTMIETATYFPRNAAEISWKAQRFMFLLRAGNAPIGVEIERFAPGKDRLPRDQQTCTVCSTHVAEDQEHHLLDCPHEQMASTRKDLWNNIASKMATLAADTNDTVLSAAQTAEAITSFRVKLAEMPRLQQLRLLLADTRARLSDSPDAPSVASGPSSAKLILPTIVNGVWSLFQTRSKILREREEAEEAVETRKAEKEKKEREETEKKMVAEAKRRKLANSSRVKGFGRSSTMAQPTLMTRKPSLQSPIAFADPSSSPQTSPLSSSLATPSPTTASMSTSSLYPAHVIASASSLLNSIYHPICNPTGPPSQTLSPHGYEDDH
jgi:hypothetical protein